MEAEDSLRRRFILPSFTLGASCAVPTFLELGLPIISVDALSLDIPIITTCMALQLKTHQ